MGRLILEGFMGCGKSTCGRIMAKEFLVPFADTDAIIEKQQGKAISRIFEEEGEGFFRDLETSLLKKLSETDEYSGGVIALGGGLPVREENRRLLKKCGTVVYIRASAGLLKDRLKSRSAKRPMLKNSNLEEKVDNLLSEREALYLDAADHVIESDGKEIFQVVNELKRIYNKEVR